MPLHGDSVGKILPLLAVLDDVEHEILDRTEPLDVVDDDLVADYGRGSPPCAVIARFEGSVTARTAVLDAMRNVGAGIRAACRVA